MNITLPVPDSKLSRRILAAVPYADRLPAGRFRPPVGIIPGNIQSLHELHLLLTPDDRSLPGVDPAKLADWVGNCVGDQQLAQQLRSLHNQELSYVEWCLQGFELVGNRVAQARKILGEEAV